MYYKDLHKVPQSLDGFRNRILQGTPSEDHDDEGSTEDRETPWSIS